MRAYSCVYMACVRLCDRVCLCARVRACARSRVSVHVRVCEGVCVFVCAAERLEGRSGGIDRCAMVRYTYSRCKLLHQLILLDLFEEERAGDVIFDDCCLEPLKLCALRVQPRRASEAPCNVRHAEHCVA